MTIVDVTKIKTIEELERVAQEHFVGKTLREIAEKIVESDGVDRVKSKSDVGNLIEEYFGIPRNSTAGADVEHLGVEIKSGSLKPLVSGEINVKEPISLSIINYNEVYRHRNIKDSSLYQKNKKILYIWYIHEKGKPRSEYLIKYVFIWEMTDAVLSDLNEDYQKLLDYIENGEAHNIHQHQHEFLTLCPKHNGDFSDPDEMTSKTSQPFSNEKAEVRGFRLKRAYMDRVVYEYLKIESPEKLGEFKKPAGY